MQPIGLAFWNEKAEASQIEAYDFLAWVRAEVVCPVARRGKPKFFKDYQISMVNRSLALGTKMYSHEFLGTNCNIYTSYSINKYQYMYKTQDISCLFRVKKEFW
jgi:hypothetical protein